MKEARKAYDKEEVPVGAVIVKNGKIIARAHNLKELSAKAVSHAEINAISKANTKLRKLEAYGCRFIRYIRTMRNVRSEQLYSLESGKYI